MCELSEAEMKNSFENRQRQQIRAAQEEYRAVLEYQMAQKDQRRSRKHYVEPKIGATPPPPTPPADDVSSFDAPQYSRVSPVRSSSGAPGGDEARHTTPAKRSMELRAALEEQIELKRQRQQELLQRERLMSRELLHRGAASVSATDVSLVARLVERQPAALHPVSYPVAPSAIDSRASPPPTWNNKEFLDLSKKDEEERLRKQQERLRAEELRNELECQIREKQQAQKERAESEKRAVREYEDRQLRQQEKLVAEERRRAEDNAKRQQMLQEDNLLLSKQKQRGAAEASSTSIATQAQGIVSKSSVSFAPVGSQEDTGRVSSDLSPIPWLKHGPDVGPAPAVSFSNSSTAAPTVSSSFGDNELRGILSRIHKELLQQRQDFLSPSIFSAVPLSNVGRLAGPSVFPAAVRNAAVSVAEELPTSDRKFISSNGVSIAGVRMSKSPQMFSMTEWANAADVSGQRLAGDEGIAPYDPISEALHRNQHRLRQLRFARHNDDVLRIFLNQDSPSSIDNFAKISSAGVDTQIPAPSQQHAPLGRHQ